VRRFVAGYPRAVWILTIANAVLWTGRGMVMPYLFIYFNEIVGLPGSVVGGGIAVSALVSSAFVILVAPLIDRRGAQPMLLLSIVGVAALTLAYPWATTIPTYLLVTCIFFMFDQLYWPAVNSTTVPLSDPSQVAEALALVRCSFIAGVGIGSLIGGVMVTGGGIDEYRAMYTVSVGVILVGGLIVWRAVPAVVIAARESSGVPGTWRGLFADRLYVATLGLLFIVIVGYSQLQVNIPAFLHREAHISEAAIGALFTVKTLVILAVQLPIAARVNRGSIGRLLAYACAFFASGLLAVTFTPEVGIPAAIILFVLFTLGEVLFAPVTSIVPVRLAPVHLRGRYFAAQSIVWGAAWGFASFAAGVALDSPRPELLWPILAVAMLVATVWSWRLRAEARLSPHV
jgi:predicted MFS family arabinose efflux permease